MLLASPFRWDFANVISLDLGYSASVIEVLVIVGCRVQHDAFYLLDQYSRLLTHEMGYAIPCDRMSLVWSTRHALWKLW